MILFVSSGGLGFLDTIVANPVSTTLFCYRRLASVGSSDRENSSKDTFLLSCLIPTVERMRAIQGCYRLPTYGSPQTDAIHMWTSVGSETTERRPTEDSNHPIIMIERLVNGSFNLRKHLR